MNRCGFVIFGHCGVHDYDDIQDIVDNIGSLHDNCDFFVNHPTVKHPKIKTRHNVGPVNHSSFIFGAFIELVKSLTEEEINSFDHFCLVSANQYFIRPFDYEKNINYVMFYNTPNWDSDYTGKDFSTDIKGDPLTQPYGRWDQKDMHKVLNVPTPMASNWEHMTLTRESMLLCKKHIDVCIELYPNQDMISLYPGFMALLTGQEWKFPPFFGTFDPSCPNKNWILTQEQINEKFNEGYVSVKRVNYKKDCPLKTYIKKEILKNEQ